MLHSFAISSHVLLQSGSVAEMLRTIPAGDLVPWVWEVNNYVYQTIADNDLAGLFIAGSEALVHSVQKQATTESEQAKEKLAALLSGFKPNQWRDVLRLAKARNAVWTGNIDDRIISNKRFAKRIPPHPKNAVFVLNLQNPKHVQSAKDYFEVHERPDCHAIDAQCAFEEVSKQLLERGITTYPFDLGAEPANSFRWYELLKNKVYVPPDFQDLQKIFAVHRMEKLPEDILEAIGSRQDVPALCEQAAKGGFGFTQALRFCLAGESPLQIAADIGLRVEKFRRDGVPFETFGELAEEDKIALYALALPFLKINVETLLVPNYSNFVKFLELALTFSGPRVFEELTSPLSPFIRNACFLHKPLVYIGGVKDNLDFIFTTLGLLTILYESREKLGFSTDLLAKIYQDCTQEPEVITQILYHIAKHLLKSGEEGYKFDDIYAQTYDFSMHNIWIEGGMTLPLKERLEAVLQAYECDLKDKPAKIQQEVLTQIFLDESPLQCLEELQRYLQYYREHPFLNKEYYNMPTAEKLAVYVVTAELYKEEESDFPLFPNIQEFSFFGNMEGRRVVMGGNAISLADIAEAIRPIFKGLSIEEGIIRPNAFENFLKIVSGWIFELGPLERLCRIRSGLLRGDKELNFAFIANLGEDPRVVSEDKIEAALELFEEGYAVSGALFKKYAEEKNRKTRLAQLKARTQALIAGEPTGDLEDPFEVIAIIHATRKKYNNEIGEILKKVEIPPVNPDAEKLPSFEFKAGLQKLSIREQGIKGNIEQIARRFHPLAFVRHVARMNENFQFANFNKLPKILQEKILRFFEISSPFELRGKLPSLTPDQCVSLAKQLVETMVKEEISQGEILQMALLTLAYAESKKQNRNTLFRRRVEEMREDLSDEEFVDILKALHEFLSDRDNGLATVVQTHLGGKHPKLGFWMRDVAAILRRVEINTMGPVTVIMKPCRQRLDAISGYLVENCLATPEYALHWMKDDGLVFYRILIRGENEIREKFESLLHERRITKKPDEGILGEIRAAMNRWIEENGEGFDIQWRGTVQTYTKWVEVWEAGKWNEKKMLIVAGIDPQLDLNLNVQEFMEGLREGFLKVAREGGYDLVVLPVVEGMQSSRRPFAVPEIKKQFANNGIIRVRRPIGFPRKGVGENADAFYNNRKQNQFLVMISGQEIHGR